MKEAQKEALLETFGAAHTCREVAAMHGVNYHTARRLIIELKDKGLIAELPFRKDKEILYQVRPAGPTGVLTVQYGEKLMALGEAVDGLKSVTSLHQFTACILSYLYQRSTYLTSEEVHKAGYITPVEAKNYMRRTRESAQALVTLLDQLLHTQPLWQESSKVVDLYGSSVNILDGESWVQGFVNAYNKENHAGS